MYIHKKTFSVLSDIKNIFKEEKHEKVYPLTCHFKCFNSRKGIEN